MSKVHSVSVLSSKRADVLLALWPPCLCRAARRQIAAGATILTAENPGVTTTLVTATSSDCHRRLLLASSVDKGEISSWMDSHLLIREG